MKKEADSKMPTEKIKTAAVCYRTGEMGELRYGLWVMSGPSKGIFVPGDRDEILPSFRTSDGLEWECTRPKGQFRAVKVSPETALEILENWSEGREQVRKLLQDIQTWG